ncbi:MAG: ATP-binding protein [Bacteroidales bacterium]
MIKQSVLTEVIRQQRERLQETSSGYIRSLLPQLPDTLENHALIISGIRRCGKSTLLHQLIDKQSEQFFFLNFDTPKLYNFDIHDFQLVDSLIDEHKSPVLFFDEIQIIQGWEMYVRQKLDEGFRVIVTGSNASLLSKELGTKLTGRHITKELFPFSFTEFCEFKSIHNTVESFSEYSNSGGFPEYVKTKNPDILTALLDDILYRDIAVRHNIKDVKSLQRLISYLAANVGNLVSANKLTRILGIKSTATVMEYFNYFEQSYVVQLMPKFSYSHKVQIVNPRKIYFIDNGLLSIISTSFNKDEGHKLENIVFWELRRHKKELFYFNEKGKECDFVVCTKNSVEQLIQVCYTLHPDNMLREQNGLLEAMDFFNFQTGTIVTYNQQDVIIHKDKRINVVSVNEFLKFND